MQGILQKHEMENRMLAEKLLSIKQQIIDSDNFNIKNQKYPGMRWTSFGKGNAVLYFTEEIIGNNRTDVTFYLVMEYGSGKAIKVNLSELKEFYLVEHTHQV